MVVLVIGNSLLVDVLLFQFSESPAAHRHDIATIVDVDIEYKVSPMLGLVRYQCIPVAAKSYDTAIIAGRHILSVKRTPQHCLPIQRVRATGCCHHVGHA